MRRGWPFVDCQRAYSAAGSSSCARSSSKRVDILRVNRLQMLPHFVDAISIFADEFDHIGLVAQAASGKFQLDERRERNCISTCRARHPSSRDEVSSSELGVTPCQAGRLPAKCRLQFRFRDGAALANGLPAAIALRIR